MGHVIRSLSIADILKSEFECHFIINDPPDFVKTQILAICDSLIELDSFSNLQEEARHISKNVLKADDIIVLDGYKFKTSYQKISKEAGVKLVCIDDIHSYQFVADAIINHAGGVSEYDYRAAPYTKFYLGLKYVMLRKEFSIKMNTVTLEERSGDNTFICLGGADPKNDTLNILKLCEEKCPDDNYWLVLGGAYKHKSSLNAYLDNSNLSIRVLENLEATDMAKYMLKCKTAITSPSTISYEYLSIGGTLYLHQTADNQNDIYKYFISEGLAFPSNSFSLLSKETKELAIKKQSDIFDGKASQRILNIFKNLN